MLRPNATQRTWARRVLAAEAVATGVEVRGGEALRVYDKLNAQLSPLLGAVGFQALFARSVKLACAAESIQEVNLANSSPDGLNAYLRTLSVDAAEAVFGTLLALMTMFIGERLTMQALLRGWPMIEQTFPETDK